MPGLAVALAVHALALGALLLIGGENDAATPSDADPILLMLGGDDPDKDAGLAGRERGPARGTEDGDPFDSEEFSKRLEALREENERLVAEEEAQAAAAAAEAAARAERERAEAAEKAAREKAAAEKAARERAAAEAAKKKAEAAKNAAAAKNSGDAKKVDIRQLVKNNRKNGGSGKNPGGRSSGGNAPGKRVGEVKVGGGGNGKAFGTVDGTGGNGGDGGARVADARALYVKAVLKRFEIFFDDVVAQEPLSIPSSITVDVRFTVDARGNVRFLDVVGSSEAQVRARVEKIFRLAFPKPFQPPPGGDPFTGRLNGVSFVVD
ncbi:hypothetical protein [Candidatus Spyradosoma sp. SGI.093]|uniref:hypothetical protein n=1 Tax=Candidatus Spyradosoma sp. SGI.093 TaxID=3420583 RepID=UPI003CFBF40E